MTLKKIQGNRREPFKPYRYRPAGIFLPLLIAVVISVFTKQSLAQSPVDWQSYNHAYSLFDSFDSEQAQEGRVLASIDGTAVNFSEYRSSPYIDFQPRGYLYQTIEAGSYRGKHLHVSAFARNIKPDFDELDRLFAEHLEQLRESQESIDSPAQSPVKAKYVKERSEWEAEREALLIADFSNDIRESYVQSEYGVWVLLHMQGGTEEEPIIRKYNPTSIGNISNPQLWHRFNVEVSVPQKCEKISIVFWSKGVSKAQVDHFAVVEHGTELSSANYGDYFSRFDKLYEELKRRGAQTPNASFRNLSFEQQ